MSLIKNFFDYTFSRKKQLSFENDSTPQTEPETLTSATEEIQHPQGDFYAVDGICITCGAPEVEAPDLIEHQEGDYGHCYFKKQPETEDEINRAVNAVYVSCIAGLRYRGTNENILKKLYELGQQDQCDNKPIHYYKEVVRNKVEFKYEGDIFELQNMLINEILIRDYYKVIDLKTNEKNFFQFTFRWTDGLTGTIYKCKIQSNGAYMIEMSKEKKGYFTSIRSNAQELNRILTSHSTISEICWFNYDGQIKPF